MTMEKSRILDLYKKEIISLEEATELLDAIDEVMPEEEIREDDRQRRDSSRRASEFMQNLKDSTSRIVDETRDFLRSEKVRTTTEKAANTVKDVFTSIFNSISDGVNDIYSNASSRVDELEIEVLPAEGNAIIADGYSLAGSAQNGGQPEQHFEMDVSADGIRIDDRNIAAGTAVTFPDSIRRIAVYVPQGIFANIIRRRRGKTLIRAELGGSIISLSGMNSLTAETVLRDTAIDVSGGSKIGLRSIAGNSRVTISGACEFYSVDASCESLRAQCSGACSMKIGSGEINTLNINVSGATDANIQCTVGGGEADASGASAIHISSVTGSMTQRVSGVSSISCGA